MQHTPTGLAAVASLANARIFLLIQPTGHVHVGNYLGAVRNWRSIAAAAPEGTHCLFGTADLHSLTRRTPAQELRDNRHGVVAALLACGLDPRKCTLFHQSLVPAHSELHWILTCLTSVGALSRMTQWKHKAQLERAGVLADEAGRAKAGYLMYPVLQAADILLYNSTHVPVGDDQSQHLELCRALAAAFNGAYGAFFTLPATLLTPAKKIASLRDPLKKMSKSDPDQLACVFLTDSDAAIARKVRRAVTDSVQGPLTYDPQNRPGVANLLRIIAGVEDVAVDETARRLAGLNHGQLKQHATDVLVAELAPKRREYERLMQNRHYLDEVTDHGAERAREIANRNLKEIKRLVGLA